MKGEDGGEKPARKHAVWICPGCGKTVHYGRLYCDCRRNLSRAASRLTENPPEIGRCNFETSGLSCNDCPEDCDWCASFGELITNRRGFGGKDCRHNGGTARCYCCQAQIKIGLMIGEISISKIMGSVTSERLRTMANLLREKIEEPVQARIRRVLEKAG